MRAKTLACPKREQRRCNRRKSQAAAFAALFLPLLLLLSCGAGDGHTHHQDAGAMSETTRRQEDPKPTVPSPGDASAEKAPLKLRIVSYNVENLFDTRNDPDTDDEDFTPGGLYRWTENKYRRKVSGLASVLSDIGGWDYPALVGLAEIENLEVVRDLVKAAPIRRADYRTSVSRGADPRGIDVALLWNPRHFRHKESYEIPHYGAPLYYPLRKDPRTKRERSGKGRSTLWVVLEEKSTGDLYDILVVHLPSRRSGVNATSSKREEVSGKINRVLDVIEGLRETPRIIVMGDFNDSPTNISVKDSLRSEFVGSARSSFKYNSLYNLASGLEEQGLGSHYFEKEFWVPDQIMVSGALLDPKSNTRVTPAEERIYSPRRLRDGRIPKRSFRGSRFSYDGFSDHFPVYADLTIE